MQAEHGPEDAAGDGAPAVTSLVAGPPLPSPPLAVALGIIALGFAGPVVFVRAAVPSLFLTLTTLILPVAGCLALYGWLQSARQFRADRLKRARAEIGGTGIALLPRPGTRQVFSWAEIAGVSVTRSELVLHLRGEDGRRRRRVLRYAGVETEPAAFGAAAAAALERHRAAARAAGEDQAAVGADTTSG